MSRRHLNHVISLAAATLIALGLLWAPPARADGDPASDVLYGQRAFLPYDVAFPGRLQQQLRQLLAAGSAAGYPIRVAIIASDYDLGSVGQLWGRPQTYARFLGIELSLSYRGLLLVVMPNGFGIYHAGQPVTKAAHVLETVPIRPGARGLAQTAIDAVRRLASVAGHPLALPQPHPTRPAAEARASSRRTRDWLIITAGFLLVAGAWAISLRLRPPRTAARQRPVRTLLRRVGPIWGLVALVGIGLLVADVMLMTRSAGPGPQTKPQAAAPDATWASGTSRAPVLDLADEHGRPTSLQRGDGRATIVSFIDPVCRDYCPLEAQVLNKAIARLPAGARPRVVAVSVNPPADTATNVRLDQKKWHLTTNWHWAFGSRDQLARVWRAYGITVQTIPQTTAGITIRKLVHTEAAYLVDAQGYKRALLLWPFKASTIERTMRSLTGGAG